MRLNHDAVQEVASMAFLANARDAFGEQGEDCLRRLLDGVRSFFQVVPPDGLSATFVFVCRLAGHEEYEPEESLDLFATSVDVGSVAGHRHRMEAASVVVVDVGVDGRYDLAEGPLPPLEAMSRASLVFVNQNGVDQFVIGGRSSTLPQLATGARSNFAVATVAELDEALEMYRKQAASVSCPILATVWEGGRDGPRLAFKNKPEKTMLRSLQWYLSVRVDGASVRPEHNTDESNPVDLVVDWFGSKKRALIEIKWMGKSLTRDSDGTQFTTYGASRVVTGANQLAGYLDRERSTDAEVSLRGYLTVFDGRRRRVSHAMTGIPEADACYFRDKDITLEARHMSEASMVAGLVRYFLEPRVSDFASPRH